MRILVVILATVAQRDRVVVDAGLLLEALHDRVGAAAARSGSGEGTPWCVSPTPARSATARNVSPLQSHDGRPCTWSEPAATYPLASRLGKRARRRTGLSYGR